MFINLLEPPQSFGPTWKYTLPSQYKDISIFLSQFYNQSCIENFLLDPKYERCISSTLYNKISSIENNLPRAVSGSDIPDIKLPEISQNELENFNDDEEDEMRNTVVQHPDLEALTPEDERKCYIAELYRVLTQDCVNLGLIQRQ
jgi:hypothetical protein